MTLPPSPLQAVVDIFSGPLQGIRFADIDGDGLGNLAADVDALSTEVEAQESHLAALREALAQKQETLLALAQQALAYARIYAESDEALAAELNEIVLPRATKPKKSASLKSPSERGAKAAKEDADHLSAEALVEVAEAPSKSRRKANAGGATTPVQEVQTDATDDVAIPPKGGRRKIPARSGRGR
jgi:hypothetical protein